MLQVLSAVGVVILAVLVTWEANNAWGIDYNQPITPAVYFSDVIHAGFSTDYFKANNLKKYNAKNIEDVKAKGFNLLRMRCNASRHNVNDPDAFGTFLDNLERVVNDSLSNEVAPILSWLDHTAEACADENDRQNYIAWWTGVAERLKDKNYRLAFNLFTENGVAVCDRTGSSEDSLRANLWKYTNWTKSVITAIRGAGGNNANRMIILTAPGKKADSLEDIDQSILDDCGDCGAEFHLYAAGATHDPGQRQWIGNGSAEHRQKAIDSITPAVAFTNQTGIPTFHGAWMCMDNHKQSLTEAEAIAFCEFYAEQLKLAGIPWAINKLDHYYNTKKSLWLTEDQTFTGKVGNEQVHNTSKFLDAVLAVY